MRSMSGALQTALATDIGQKMVHLVRFDFYDIAADPVHISTGSKDQTIDVGSPVGSQLWEGIGGNIEIQPIPETGDLRTQGISLVLPAVDQTIVADLAGKKYVGRTLRVWRAYMTPGTDTVIGVLPLFTGLMDSWNATEKRGRSRSSASLSLRATSRLAPLNRIMGLQTNLASHQNHDTSASTDTFFDVVPKNAREVEPWGSRVLEES